MLSVAARNLLIPVVQAIVGYRPGVALGNGTLKALLQRYDKESIVEYLASQAELYTQNRLSVQPAGPRLLHGYISGTNVALVACPISTPRGDINDPSLVGRAWFLTDAGLLPAHFDHMPEEAMEFIEQSNNL